MKYKVTIVPAASDDIRLAAKWYDKQRKGLGKEFIASLREGKELLTTNPYFVIRYKKVHTLPLQRFPFLVHFVIDKRNKTVTILAVLHTSLDPKKNWL